MRLGLREANQRFSAAVRAVRAGEEVVITDRGRPLAILAPWRQDDAFQRMAQAGILRPASKSIPMPAARPIRLRRGSVSQLLDRERSAG